MQWIDVNPVFKVASADKVDLLRQAIAHRPGDPALHEKLGLALVSAGDYGEAIDAFDFAVQREPQRVMAWAGLAHCYVEEKRLDDALDVCRRSEAHGSTAAIHYERGRVLHKQGRTDDAVMFLRAAVASGDGRALKDLLLLLARNSDGAALLAFCDELPAALRDTALVRGNRAIALSRVGRSADALRLVDLEQHVAQVSLKPPPGFASIESFNHALARETLDTAPQEPDRPLNIDYELHAYAGPAYTALRAMIQAAIENYLTEAEIRGLAAIMPPPPERGVLAGASVVLRGTGRNGEHLHADGYVSSVYYVSVPDCVSDAADERGALALGKCVDYTKGYAPCWGARHLKPVPGQLVIFPSHVFHDVVPTESEVPRISVAADLRPAQRGTAGEP